MAALIFCTCSALHQIFGFTDVLLRTGGDFRKTLHIIRKRKNLHLYRNYCKELWLNESIEYCNKKNTIKINEKNVSQHERRKSAKNVVKEDKMSSSSLRQKMQRDGIDFAAIEASAMAFEAIDTFAARRPSELSTDFLESERHYHYDAMENYNFDDIEIITPTEIDTIFYDASDQLPVFTDNNIAPLTEGLSFTITGFIEVNCERFSINFIIENETRDIALHINPRLPQSFIVRNTKVRKIWGHEEGYSALPFTLHRGAKFTIQILVTDACFMISVNGYHFAEYKHRLPYDHIETLEVKGEVSNIKVVRGVVTQYPERGLAYKSHEIRVTTITTKYAFLDSIDDSEDVFDEIDVIDARLKKFPDFFRTIRMAHLVDRVQLEKISPRNLSLPYYGHFPANTLSHGKCLQIEGRVKLLPHSFYINFQAGQHIWPHPIIAFHYNPRFTKQSSGTPGKAIICRNAWLNGKWGTEERSELESFLRPGITFTLSIVCGNEHFSVYVNRKFVTQFKYRVQPEIVDSIYIQGDIKLWDVYLEHRPIPSEMNVYSNPSYVERDTENDDNDDDDTDGFNDTRVRGVKRSRSVETLTTVTTYEPVEK